MPPDIELYCFLYRGLGELAPEAEKRGLRIISGERPRWLPWALYRVMSLTTAIKKVQPHIIHVHHPSKAIVAAAARRFAGSKAPIIAHHHGDPLHWRSRWSTKESSCGLASRLTSLILCVSAATREALIGRYRLAPEKVRALYTGVPLEEFRRLPGGTEARQRLGLSPSELVFVFVGRLEVRTKGLDVLLQAASLLAQQGLAFTLLIVGPGAAAESLGALCEQLGISQQVRFLGRWSHPDILIPLRAADVFVLPSRAEGLPLGAAEAAAVGLPLVATRVGGVAEVVEHGVNGLLVPPGDPEALAETMLWMAEHPEERACMGQAGRRLIYERFDMQVTTRQLADIYRELATLRDV